VRPSTWDWGISAALPPAQLASAAVIFFLSALLQGMTGFGFVLFSAPVLSMVTGTKVAIPLITSTAFINAIILATSNRKGIRFREIGCLLPGSFLAIPLGAWFLHHYDDHVLRIGLALFIFLFAVYSMLGRVRLHLKTDLWPSPSHALGLLRRGLQRQRPAVFVYAQLRHWDQQASGLAVGLSRDHQRRGHGLAPRGRLSGMGCTSRPWSSSRSCSPARSSACASPGGLSSAAFNRIIQGMLVVLSPSCWS
jgi:hypothetical protein